MAYRSKAKIPVLSLTKLIERDKPRITPAPVSVNAVRCVLKTEEKAVTPSPPGGEVQTVATGKSSTPDYFYDDF